MLINNNNNNNHNLVAYNFFCQNHVQAKHQLEYF